MKQAVTTSRAILDASIVLFAEQGYDGTSVSEIAKTAGVATGTVIYQYKSKENLLQVIAWECFNGLLQQLRQSGKPKDGRVALTSYIRAFFDFIASHRPETTVMLRHHMVFRSELQRFPLAADGFRALDVCIQELREVLVVLFEENDLDPAMVDQVHAGFLAKLLGACWMFIFAGRNVAELENEILCSVLLRLDQPAVLGRSATEA